MAFEHAIILTGGIASGKSTACTLLKLRGFTIIDADVIAHQVLEEQRGEISRLFGEDFVVSGKVDRKRLGALIFTDEEARRKLEGLLHPLIQEKIIRESERMDGYGVPYLIDIPLYFERKSAYGAKKVAVVYTPKEIQIQRLCEREGFREDEALQRLNAQLDIEEKRKDADFVIDNSGNLKQLQDEIDRFVEFAKDGYAGIKV